MVDKKKSKLAKKTSVKKASAKKTSVAKKSSSIAKTKTKSVVKKASSKAKSTTKKSTANKAVEKEIVKKPAVKKAAAKEAAKEAAKKPVKKITVSTKKTTVKKPIKKVIKKVDKNKNNGMVVGPVSKSSSSAGVNKEINVRKSVKKDEGSRVIKSDATPDSLSFEGISTEDYMNDVQSKHFEQVLNTWKEKLLEEVGSTVVHLKEDVEALADPLDRAAQEEGFRLELRTRDRERKLIKKIEKSLDDIKTGDYGFCKDCGIEIGLNRLEARPTAVRCIDCKTIQEIKEKQGAA